MRRRLFILILVGLLTVPASITASAGQWLQDGTVWQYQQYDGQMFQNGWQWIDGKCYYFDSEGRMLADTVTPDGYTVNAAGAWVIDGVVQRKAESQAATNHSTEPEEYAREVFDLVNAERVSAGNEELEWDETLYECASERAEEQAEKYGHTRPDGSSWTTILEEYDVDCYAWGENIAMGQRTPEAVMDDWMHSAGHKKNILLGSYRRMGVGCYYSNGSYHWVQIFTD